MVIALNNLLRIIQDEIVVLARTSMKNQHICVGGYSIRQRRYVRLLDEWGQNLSDTEPYTVGQVYLVEYKEKENIILPHREDVCVNSYEFKENMTKPLLMELLGKICISNIHIKDLFDGLLCWENSKGFLLKNNDFPSSSVVIVQLNHDLFLSQFEDNRFYYKDFHINEIFNVKYVGVDDIGDLRRIQLGTYLRFSLARWWDNDGKYSVPRSYLQLSGIFQAA